MPTRRIHWLRTLIEKGAHRLAPEDLRYVSSRPGAEALHCVLLDCSGSMLAGGKLAHAKGVLLAMLDDASRRRHKVALVCFGGGGAHRRFGPAVPRWWNERWVSPIGGGGGTSLRRGVEVADALLRRADAGSDTWLWLLTDGRSTDVPPAPRARQVIVVDFDTSPLRLASCRQLAARWQADYLTMLDLGADSATRR